MINEYPKERNIFLKDFYEIYKYEDYQFDEESPYQVIIVVLEKYLIKHRYKTIIDVLCQINDRQMMVIEKLRKIDEDVSFDFISETFIFQELFTVKNHLIKTATWLYEGQMPEEFEIEFFRVAAPALKEEDLS